MGRANESIFEAERVKASRKTFNEIHQLEFHLTVLSDNNSKFRDANVKLDEKGILRCEGCLKFTPILQETKSPNLLNDKHPLSKLISFKYS